MRTCNEVKCRPGICLDNSGASDKASINLANENVIVPESSSCDDQVDKEMLKGLAQGNVLSRLGAHITADTVLKLLQMLPPDEFDTVIQTVTSGIACHDRTGNAISGGILGEQQPSIENKMDASESRSELRGTNSKGIDGVSAERDLPVASDFKEGEVVEEPVDAKQVVTQLDTSPPPSAAKCLLQWSAYVYYVGEEQGWATAHVQRLGATHNQCSVKYTTVNSSAKAGVRYEHVEGNLHFAPGEHIKSIKVTILQDDAFDATLEFKVRLTDAQNAFLGRYLHTCNIKVIDDDVFPSNKFREHFASYPSNYFSRPENLDKKELFHEYLKCNFANPIVRRGTLKMLIVDQFRNLEFICKLFVNKYIIDEVLRKDDDHSNLIFQSRMGTLIFLVILLLIPYVLLHVAHVRSRYWKVGGTSRKMLQTNLLRRFLNYDEYSRCSVVQSDLMMTVSRDVSMLVSDGYMSIVTIIRNAGQLTIICLFQLMLLLYADQANFQQLVILIFCNSSIPLLLYACLALRQKRFMKLLTKRMEAQDDVVEHVDSSIDNFHLIRDYDRRSWASDEYDEKIKRLNKAETKYSAYAVQNLFFAPLLATILVSIYVVFGGSEVIAETVSLGTFLTTLKLIKAIGGSWNAIYEVMLNINSVIPALLRVTHFLNLPVDTRSQMQHENNELRRSMENLTMKKSDVSPEKLEKLRKLNTKNLLDHDDVDDLKIYARSVEFVYSKHMWSDEVSACCGLRNCDFEVSQGKLICFVGPSGEGKATILKLIGGVVLPQKGEFYLPPHLKILHVTNAPAFWDTSLLNNLTFGCEPDDSDAKPDSRPKRVRQICRRLGLRDQIVAMLDNDDGKILWKEVLSSTQGILLGIARALIANPEVLVIHTPTATLADASAKQVLSVLHDFVANRGVEKKPEKRHMRRPRTCFFTASRAVGIDISDEVFEISSAGIIRTTKERYIELYG